MHTHSFPGSRSLHSTVATHCAPCSLLLGPSSLTPPSCPHLWHPLLSFSPSPHVMQAAKPVVVAYRTHEYRLAAVHNAERADVALEVGCHAGELELMYAHF